MKNLNQQSRIFWKGKLVKFVNWESLNLNGKLKIKVGSQFIEVNINELTN